MNIVLWIAASVLALVFFASGLSKIVQPREKIIASGFAWAEDFSPTHVKLIGLVEVLGAVGLVLPPALGIVEVLSPLAAAGLALVMVVAAVVHIRRDELKFLAGPFALGAVAMAVAALRFGTYSF